MLQIYKKIKCFFLWFRNTGQFFWLRNRNTVSQNAKKNEPPELIPGVLRMMMLCVSPENQRGLLNLLGQTDSATSVTTRILCSYTGVILQIAIFGPEHIGIIVVVSGRGPILGHNTSVESR